MIQTQITSPNHSALTVGKKGTRPVRVGALAPEFEKSATELKRKHNLLKFKSTIQIAKFNVGTLNRIANQLELTASAIDHDINVMCLQEHRYLHSKDIKYHDTGNEWTFLSASAGKIYVNATIGGLGILIGPRVLQSLNSIEKIQPRMMVAMFNGNPSAKIISCYNPINVSEETYLIAFYNELSSLVRNIPKRNILVIGGDMNTQIGKNLNNKFSSHNTANRNGEHLRDFTLENRLTCLNTKFQKRNENLWTYTYTNNAKTQTSSSSFRNGIIVH